MQIVPIVTEVAGPKLAEHFPHARVPRPMPFFPLLESVCSQMGLASHQLMVAITQFEALKDQDPLIAEGLHYLMKASMGEMEEGAILDAYCVKVTAFLDVPDGPSPEQQKFEERLAAAAIDTAAGRPKDAGPDWPFDQQPDWEAPEK